MSSHRHQTAASAFLVDPHRRRCPVCNQSVYSRGGVHPQCALKQADAPSAGAEASTAAAPDSASDDTGLGHES